MPFCDWLTISATVRNAPALGGGRVMSISQDGEIEWEAVRMFECEGSYDTKLRIRSDGDRLRLTGNLSRWQRPDNVFGFTVQECFQIANDVMRSLGLPSFPENAELSRVDLCDNFETGSATNAATLIRYLGGHTVGHQKPTPYGDTGVIWGKGSGLRYSKAYAKAPELERHIRKGKRGEYLTQLIAWCNHYGIVRFETELKRRYLVRHNLATIDRWDDDTTRREYREFENEVMKMSVNVDRLEDIPGRAGEIAILWRSGVDVWERLNTKATRYRLRKELLPFGIDIKQRPAVERIPTRIRTIDVCRAVPPSFYSFDHAA